MSRTAKKNKFYAYFFSEKQKGVCESWKECEKLVKGKNARYRSFNNKEEAEDWLASGAKYEIRQPAKLETGIYFDAGTGRGQGVEISVTDENGKDLLDQVLPKKKLTKHHKHLVKRVTNNYGELLACYYALCLVLKKNFKKACPEQSRKIFGDSRLVIDFWSKGIMKRKELPADTVKLADKVVELRKKFESAGGEILRVSGDDNPADLGFHK